MARLIATWFGCGYSPVAPGTAGSAAALALAILLNKYLGWGSWEFGLMAVCLVAPGIWAAREVAASSGLKDPSIVVVDEVIGQWITLIGVSTFNWQSFLGAFLLFRLFDIWKPPPIRLMERPGNGVGVVIDDVMAGIYGSLVIYGAGLLKLY